MKIHSKLFHISVFAVKQNFYIAFNKWRTVLLICEYCLIYRLTVTVGVRVGVSVKVSITLSNSQIPK